MKIDRNKIDTHLARLGISKGELAERYGTTQSAISDILRRIEDGEELQPVTVSRIAKALEVDIDDVLCAPESNGEAA